MGEPHVGEREGEHEEAHPAPGADDGEASQLWSLADIHEANGNLVSKNTAFDKQYLSGRYGADPYLTRIEEWV